MDNPNPPRRSWDRYVAPGEALNALTHAIGLALSVCALVVMLVYTVPSGDAYQIASVTIYGASLILLYLSSTLYHIAQDERVKERMNLLDHSSIFLLIAGTYTPIALVSLRGAWGWSIFGVIWGLAILGIVYTLFFVNASDKVSVAIYIAMGWLFLIAARPIVEAIPTGGIVCIVLGGVAYSGGTLFYLWRSLPHNHAIWHLCVMTGSALHFAAVYGYILPPGPLGP